MTILLVLYVAGLLPMLFISGFYVADTYVRPTGKVSVFWFCVAFAWPLILLWAHLEHLWKTRVRRLWRKWRSARGQA